MRAQRTRSKGGDVGGKASRTKGATFERHVAETFREAGVREAKRGIGQSRGGGAEVEDVVIPFLHVECKARESGALYDALKQAREDATARAAQKRPCVVYKRNNKPVLVVMELSQFAPMFGEWLTHNRMQSARAIADYSNDELLSELRRRLGANGPRSVPEPEHCPRTGGTGEPPT